MSNYDVLKGAIINMFTHWTNGNKNACYREYFSLNVEQRKIIEETLRKGSRVYPSRAQRKDAQQILSMIKKNTDKEAQLLTHTLKELMQYWFLSSREIFYSHYLALGEFEKRTIIEAIEEVFGTDENAEFRQAAIDIPKYIKERASGL